MLFEKDVLTTGEVARICNVAPRTVSKWFDSGALKGYRIPGSKDRRIPASQLVRFMKDHGIPFDSLVGGKTRVLLVDDETEILDTLGGVLTEQTNYDVQTVESAFHAGVVCERFRPHVVLIDLHLAGGDMTSLARFMQNDEELQMCSVIAMSGKLTDGQLHSLRGQGFADVLKKPFQVRQVVQAIESATSVVQ